MRLSLVVSRHGNNLFVDGLFQTQGTKHINNSTSREDMIVEPGCRAYLRVKPTESGISVDILRMKNDISIFHQDIDGNRGEIHFDPWDHV